MNSTLRPPFTPHLLRVRTAAGDTFEADLQPVYQPKLAVLMAYRLARFLAQPSTAALAGNGWLLDVFDDLTECGVELDACTVEVFRRVPAGYPGAVHGYALLIEVPVAPGIPSINPNALRNWPAAF
jgi:hypothetical protein